MIEPRLLKRRILSPKKLKAARLKAQLTNVTQLAKKIGMDRSAYLDWEKRTAPLTHVDYVLLSNALALFGCSYEDVSDPMPEVATLSPAPAQASA